MDPESNQRSSERPTKRRKLQSPEVLKFIDLEAQVSDAESDDDSELDDLFDDEIEPIPGDSYSAHRHLLRESLVPSNDEGYWEDFLQHVQQKAKDGNEEEDIEDIGSSPLWAVVVKPGYEEHAVFRIFHRLIDYRFPAHLRVPAVFGCTALPGRIFFETNLQDIICKICLGLPYVFPSNILSLSNPDPRSLLNLPDTFRPKENSWVRLNRGIYKGDLAYVRGACPSSLLICVIVVPRIIYDPPRAKIEDGQTTQDFDSRNDEVDHDFAEKYNPNPELLRKASAPGRPPQALFNPTQARQRYRRALLPRNFIFWFKGIFYDADGYAELRDLDTNWYIPEDVLPTPEEFDRFSSSSVIPLKVRQDTMAKMSARLLHVDDAVKITHGDSRGLFGRIFMIRENEAEIFLPLQGLSATIPLSSLRKEIRIGDEVRVISGDNQNITGWVVNKYNDDLCIFDHKTGTEIEVSPESVEFFSAPFFFSTSPDLKAPLTTSQKNVMKGDSNSHLIGKDVVITKGGHKTYRGRIKSTVDDKRVLVELSAKLQRAEIFDIASLRIINGEWLLPATPRNLQTDFPYPLQPAPGQASPSFLFSIPPLPRPRPSAAIPYPAASFPSCSPSEVPSTPLPTPQSIPTSSAWDPSSRTPRPGDDAPPPYWLVDDCFSMMRLSLRLINTRPDFLDGKYEGKCGEFKRVVGDTVKVQVGFPILEVPFKYLIPDRPDSAGQIVTAFDGPHKGRQFRIQRFGEDICGCSNLQAAGFRRKIDVEIPTNQLVMTRR